MEIKATNTSGGDITLTGLNDYILLSSAVDVDLLLVNGGFASADVLSEELQAHIDAGDITIKDENNAIISKVVVSQLEIVNAIPNAYTNAQMLLIQSPRIGQTIYNLTWNAYYYYDGDVWLSNGLIKAINQDTKDAEEGLLTIQDDSSDLGIKFSSVQRDVAIFGVVKDIYNGGTTGNFITIATSGNHNILFDTGQVNRGNAFYQSTTKGEAYDSSTAQTGMLGIIRGSKSSGSNGLVLCVFEPAERY